jgi:hypothetical protein
VVARRNLGRGAEELDLLQDLTAQLRMPLDDRPVVCPERCPLVEDRVRNAELSQVVEQCTDANVTQPVPGKAKAVGQAPADGGDPLRVLPGPGALGVDDVGEGRGNPIDVGVARAGDRLVGVRREDLLPERRRTQFVEESAVAELEQARGEVGIVPGTAPRADDLFGRRRPPDADENVQRGADRDDPAEERDAWATSSEQPIFRAMPAPRAQRSSSTARRSRVPDSASAISRRSCNGRGSLGRLRMERYAMASRDRPATACRALSSWSSMPKIRVTAAALLEQPASFSNPV